MSDKPKTIHCPDIITLRKLNAETGEEIPSTEAEQAEALASIKQAIEQGKLEFSDQARDSLARKGWTTEVIESWFYPKS